LEAVTLKDLRQMAEDCRAQLLALGLKPGPVATVTINRRAKTLFGRCRKDAAGGFHIEIMAYLNSRRPLEEIRQTMMHELLHTLPGCGNHGAGFQEAARRVNGAYGFHISTTGQLSPEARETIPFNYVLKCGLCGSELKKYHRKPRLTPRHFHKPCGEASQGKLELYRYCYEP